MPDTEALEVIVSTRVTRRMLAEIEAAADQDQRKPADWVRLALGAALRARKAKGKR